LCTKGFGKIDEVVIDHVWTAIRFCTSASTIEHQILDIDELNIDATVKDVVVKSSRKYSATIRTAVS
jgi:hypothetical protein